MRAFAFVFIGSGVGGLLRYAIQVAAVRAFGPSFPWGTLAINAAGSWLLALLLALVARGVGMSDDVRLLLTTGLCGGFTTYSTFNQETIALVQSGRVGAAAGYVAATVVLALAGAGAVSIVAARA